MHIHGRPMIHPPPRQFEFECFEKKNLVIYFNFCRSTKTFNRIWYTILLLCLYTKLRRVHWSNGQFYIYIRISIIIFFKYITNNTNSNNSKYTWKTNCFFALIKIISQIIKHIYDFYPSTLCIQLISLFFIIFEIKFI